MVIVAGFNMISGLLIILFEKISMIGLLKSLGMRDASIHRIFLYRAMMIVLRGIAAGNIIALILLTLQHQYGFITLDPANYFVTQVPVHIDWLKLAILNIASAVMITLILYIPSVFIAGVEPDKSLRVQ
jgi:lipoprotein-releasing system permease protein